MIPDAPVNLVNDESYTTDTVIRFTWNDGASDGGSPVLDYTVYYDEGTGSDNFVLLAESFLDSYYITS